MLYFRVHCDSFENIMPISETCYTWQNCKDSKYGFDFILHAVMVVILIFAVGFVSACNLIFS